MHIQQVRIKNIRGFGEADLDFRRTDGRLAGWTVLAGRNGSGKTTMLQAVALAIAGPKTALALQESFADWIHKGETEASVSVDLLVTDFHETDFDLSSSSRYASVPVCEEGEVVTVTLSWKAEGSGSGDPSIEADHKWSASEELPKVTPWSGNRRGWFLAGYGSTRRLMGHGAAAQRLMSGPERIARLVSLFREDASLLECVEWMREVYLQSLEGSAFAEDLLQRVIGLLNDGLLQDDVRVDRIDSRGLWIRENGRALPLETLSDGYRTTAALVMDIVRHLALSYQVDGKPCLYRDSDNTSVILNHGVVLIDEADLHLHVAWQKNLGFWLKEHFPNVQFIVTTHSPFICQAADRLFRLPAFWEDRTAGPVSEEVYNTVVNGGIDDAVLTELFGLEQPHSEPAERLRERLAELEVLLQDGHAEPKEVEELEQLRRSMPRSPSADVDQILRRLSVGR